MRKELTEEDKYKLKKTNLFRFSNEWYTVVNFVAIGSFVYSFFMPYYGWRRKPVHVPENIHEYIEDVIDMNLFILPLFILIFMNYLVKKIEIDKNYKIEKTSSVFLKRKIWFKKYIIIFKPFHLLFFSNTFKFNDVVEGSKVLIENTCLGRFLNYKKIN